MTYEEYTPNQLQFFMSIQFALHEFTLVLVPEGIEPTADIASTITIYRYQDEILVANDVEGREDYPLDAYITAYSNTTCDGKQPKLYIKGEN